MEYRNGLQALGITLFLTAAAIAPTGCASSGDAPMTAPAPKTAAESDALIFDLEAAIAVEQETLRELISAGLTESVDPLLTSDEIRGIANRLPKLQDELRGILRALEISAARDERERELQNDQDP